MEKNTFVFVFKTSLLPTVSTIRRIHLSGKYVFLSSFFKVLEKLFHLIFEEGDEPLEPGQGRGLLWHDVRVLFVGVDDEAGFAGLGADIVALDDNL